MSLLTAPRTIDVSSFRQPNGKPTKLCEPIEIPDSFQILQDGAQRPPGAAARMFRVMTPEKGDERLVWDSGRLSEIRDAFKFFKNMVAKGFKPFKCDGQGKVLPEPMKRFDAHAEEIVFLPAMAVAGG